MCSDNNALRDVVSILGVGVDQVQAGSISANGPGPLSLGAIVTDIDQAWSKTGVSATIMETWAVLDFESTTSIGVMLLEVAPPPPRPHRRNHRL